jgi:hypothetical protein
MYSIYIYIKHVLSITILSIILGCGDGSTGNESYNTPDTNEESINNEFNGHIIVSDGWIIEISSGLSSRVPGVIWDSWCLDYESGDDFDCKDTTDNYVYPSGAMYSVEPSQDGNEYIVTALDCSVNYNRDCLAIHKIGDGAPLGERGEFYRGLNFGAKLSRDNSYIALSYNENILSQTKLIILNRAYDIISSTTLPDESSVSFDWGSSGQLVYGYRRSIYVTSAYSTEGTEIFSLDSYPELANMGLSAPIRVSPDGKKVAFMLYEEDNFLSYTARTPWVVNTDGTGLHRLSHVPETMSSYQLYGSLAWSPDGEYILLMEGYSPQASSYDSGVGGNLYVIPSDSIDVALSDTGENGITRLKTNYKNRSKLLTHKFNGMGIWWIP